MLVIASPSFSGTRHRHKQSGLLLGKRSGTKDTSQVTHRLAKVVALQRFVGAVLIEDV